jgi:hypothetical protein
MHKLQNLKIIELQGRNPLPFVFGLLYDKKDKREGYFISPYAAKNQEQMNKMQKNLGGKGWNLAKA